MLCLLRSLVPEASPLTWSGGALVFALGFWGQYVFDINAWSHIASNPTVLLMTGLLIHIAVIPEAAGAPLPAKISYCSFCFKSQHQVKMLISGPAGIFICSECVELCNEYIARQPRKASQSPKPEDLPLSRCGVPREAQNKDDRHAEGEVEHCAPRAASRNDD